MVLGSSYNGQHDFRHAHALFSVFRAAARLASRMSKPPCAQQHVSLCLAQERGCSHVHGPRVVPTDACFAPGILPAFSPRAEASIVLVLGFNRSDVRPNFHRDPWQSYVDSTLLLMRCVLSLKRVSTTLPITLLVSGERDAKREAAIARHGVMIEPTLTTTLAPAWASPWMRGTFAKLSALALTRYSRVVVLDSDCVAVRNIDHLSGAPAPLAAYFHFDLGFTCPQDLDPTRACARGVLNSGVLALQPDARRLSAAQRLLAAGTHTWADGGVWEASDQRLWHALYEEVHELPFGYNANADANMTRESWSRVFVLHDIIVQRKRGWRSSGYHSLVANLTRAARREFESD